MFTTGEKYTLLKNGLLKATLHTESVADSILSVHPLYTQDKLNVKGFIFVFSEGASLLKYLKRSIHKMVNEDNLHVGYENDYSAICNYHSKEFNKDIFTETTKLFDEHAPSLPNSFVCLYGYYLLLQSFIRNGVEKSGLPLSLKPFQQVYHFEDEVVMTALENVTKILSHSNKLVTTTTPGKVLLICQHFISSYKYLFKCEDPMFDDKNFLHSVYTSLADSLS